MENSAKEKIKEAEKEKESSSEEKLFSELRKEVESAVREEFVASAAEKGDIAPLRKLVGKKLEEGGIVKKDENAKFEEGKVFWDLVGESLKEGVFREIHGIVFSAVERGECASVEKLIEVKLYEVIKFLSPTIYRDKDELNTAIVKLKSKFYETFPGFRELMYGEGQRREAKEAVPGAGAPKEPGRGESFAKERDWSVPDLGEIKPGLVIEVENAAQRSKKEFLVLSEPFQDKDGDLWIAARDLKYGYEGRQYLAEMGIVPHKDGYWSRHNRPVSWYYTSEGGVVPGNPFEK